MADSIREKILQSVQTQLTAITTANGYAVQVVTVERVRRGFSVDEVPAIGIWEAGETSENDYNDSRNTLSINTEFVADATTTNRSVYANTLLAELKQAILAADRQHGGDAISTSYTGATIRIPEDDNDTQITVVASFNIVYAEVAGDPFTIPS